MFPKFSDLTKLIEADFSKVLMIRQAIGKAVVNRIASSQAGAKIKLFSKLLTAFLNLSNNEKALRSMLKNIIEEAVSLANQMTREQAIFRCQMAKTGFSPLADVNVKVADAGQEGDIFMCTFPGFGRRIVDDRKEKIVWLVPSNAELTSAFRRRR